MHTPYYFILHTAVFLNTLISIKIGFILNYKHVFTTLFQSCHVKLFKFLPQYQFNIEFSDRHKSSTCITLGTK